MKNLIITADDYGMSLSVNNAIEECAAAGIVNATNLMVGMKFYESIVNIKKYFPKISIGLHWTLTAGYPVSDKREIPSLVNNDGLFWSYPEFRNKLRRRIISFKEIKKELLAQYQRYINICGEPDYWNTHQNVHIGFRIFDTFLDVASSLRILKMRNHNRLYVRPKGEITISASRRVIEPVKRIILKYWQLNANRIDIKSPDGLITLLCEEDKFDLEYVFSNIVWRNKRLGELVIHPATLNDSVYFGNITENRIKEYNLFRNPQVRELALERGIFLCGFEEII
ncbi:MAG: ChbG/HpnK family deacetylase [Eubacteriales bacterium]|jgi:hypothetical protein